MHPQLEMLLEIQDLKTQRGELAQLGEGRSVEEDVFNITVEDALQQLDGKIVEMEESLEPSVKARFTRLLGTRGRFIVPVINGTCFGCFVSIPTSVTSEGNLELRYCDHCARFLYFVD